jgi:ABC-type multidrug transport system ATPase subunit
MSRASSIIAEIKGGIKIVDGQSEHEAIESQVELLLQEMRFTTPTDADLPVGTYSGGMKRKVSIALALLGDPEIVIFGRTNSRHGSCKPQNCLGDDC